MNKITRYSVQPSDRMFIKDYGFLSFGKNMCKNIGKNICKSLNSKYSPGMLSMRQKLLDHVNQSPTDPIKTSSKRFIQKTAEATCDLIDSKIANKITNVSKNSETVTSEHSKEIPKERYVSPEERQEIIDEWIDVQILLYWIYWSYVQR